VCEELGHETIQVYAVTRAGALVRLADHVPPFQCARVRRGGASCALLPRCDETVVRVRLPVNLKPQL
jgi:hypothetical protein